MDLVLYLIFSNQQILIQIQESSTLSPTALAIRSQKIKTLYSGSWTFERFRGNRMGNCQNYFGKLFCFLSVWKKIPNPIKFE